MLLDILNTPSLLTEQNRNTIDQIADCLASTIYFLTDTKHFSEVVHDLQRDSNSKSSSEVPLVKLRAYLQIVQGVVERASWTRE